MQQEMGIRGGFLIDDALELIFILRENKTCVYTFYGTVFIFHFLYLPQILLKILSTLYLNHSDGGQDCELYVTS